MKSDGKEMHISILQVSPTTILHMPKSTVVHNAKPTTDRTVCASCLVNKSE